MPKINFLIFILLISIAFSRAPAADKLQPINVVAATPDLADLARTAGGDKVNVISLTKGAQDLHSIEPRPSMVMLVKRADLLIRIGMDLDLWMQSLIDASRNSKVMFGGPGYLDASANISKLEVPAGKVEASMGDIHIYGNPHYWLDPENSKIIIEAIVKKLCRLRPEFCEYFKTNQKDFNQKLDSANKRWKETLKPFAGSEIVTYHNSWPYFAKRFGFKLAGFIESKPGIPPAPAHIISLEDTMKKNKIKVILVEPYLDINTVKRIAADTGATALVLPPSVGAVHGVNSYIGLFDYNVDKIAEILKK